MTLEFILSNKKEIANNSIRQNIIVKNNLQELINADDVDDT